MAFEGLASKLQGIFKKLGNRGKLSEKEVKEVMREVKLALLEADVNFAVVKSFINSVTQRAVGTEVLQSLTPSQQIIKIVNEELTNLMGGSVAKLNFRAQARRLWPASSQDTLQRLKARNRFWSLATSIVLPLSNSCR